MKPAFAWLDHAALLLFGSLSLASLSLISPTVVSAQEFTQIQSLTSHVLFVREDHAAQQRKIERQRIEALDRRAQQQALLLEQQSASVQQLSDQLQAIRDEKLLVDMTEAFDTAVLTGQASAARALLANEVSILSVGGSGSPSVLSSADVAIATAPISTAIGSVLPRFNQRVRVDGDRAVLTSDGYAWARSRDVRTSLSTGTGKWVYSFTRTQEGWKIDGLSFSH